jgi:nucleoside-diphosphate-sugar epimerase
MRIFLAGATGAIGRRRVPLLLRAGHHVDGTTATLVGRRHRARQQTCQDGLGYDGQERTL